MFRQFNILSFKNLILITDRNKVKSLSLIETERIIQDL